MARLDTFGSPRLGDEATARKLALFVEREKVHRVYLGNDLVTRVALSDLGWWHPIGTPIHLTRTGAISGVEEWRRTRKAALNTRQRAMATLSFVAGMATKRLGSIRDHDIDEYVEQLGLLVGVES